MTTKAAATVDDLPDDSPALRHGQSTAAARTTAMLGLADVVATSSSARRRRFDEVSTTDNGATPARKVVKKRGEKHVDLKGLGAL
ncbi:hypothetical protein Scep_022015 [Stephania cephalantha]|uniref:Uncharacterized protein n=1 Tax=Stephania cephalantha TaxID=152367 RepID=A0AAP0F4J2_9MAGN